MSGFSTVRDRAEALREGIEELLLEESLRAATEHLKEAEATISRFCELGPSDEGLSALDRLRATLDLARSALASTPASDPALVEEAISWTTELRMRALDELARIAPVELVDQKVLPFGFRASRGAPTLHEAKDVPPLEVFARKRPWDAIVDEDDDEDATRRLARAPIDAGLERIGRDAMEDLAILGGLRRCDGEEKWTDAVGFEERLLANLDLLWSLDVPAHDDVPKLGVPRALFRYATEWALPDWGRAFAVSFGLGCSSSEAALRWVMLAMRRSATSVLGAYVHGLSIGSSPWIDRTVSAELRSEGSPELLTALLEIAERRSVFEASAVVPLLAHPVSSVRIAALRAMRSAPQEIAIASAEATLDSPDRNVALEAADELARRNHPRGLSHMRELLHGGCSSSDKGVALRALALAGNAKDEALLVEHGRDREDGVVWLSFFGKPSVVPVILDELRKARAQGIASGDRVARTERAFNRVTGIVPTGEENALQAKFDETPASKSGVRLRGGEPISARALVAELSSPSSRQGERRVLARELWLHLPSPPRFDADAFVATQLAMLGSIDLR